MGTLKVGTRKPGVSQQVFLLQPFCGGSGGLPQPGIPAQAALGSPHLMQAVWLHAGGESATETVNVVWMPVGKGNAKPSAVAQGVWRHVPDCPPQSASLRRSFNPLAGEL